MVEPESRRAQAFTVLAAGGCVAECWPLWRTGVPVLYPHAAHWPSSAADTKIAGVNVRPRESTHAELVTAAKGHTTPDRALLARAAAGREAS